MDSFSENDSKIQALDGVRRPERTGTNRFWRRKRQLQRSCYRGMQSNDRFLFFFALLCSVADLTKAQQLKNTIYTFCNFWYSQIDASIEIYDHWAFIRFNHSLPFWREVFSVAGDWLRALVGGLLYHNRMLSLFYNNLTFCWLRHRKMSF